MEATLERLLGSWGVERSKDDPKSFVVPTNILRNLVGLAFGLYTFNEENYLSVNGDVAEAVARGEFLSGREHYIKLGVVENRIVDYGKFDEISYLISNPDVKRAVDRQEFKDAAEHWREHGWIEGRPTGV